MKTRPEIIKEAILNELMSPTSYGFYKRPIVNTLKSLTGLFRGGDPITGLETQGRINALRTYQQAAGKQAGKAALTSFELSKPRGGEFSGMSQKGREELKARADLAVRQRRAGMGRAEDRIVGIETAGQF